MPLWVCFSNVYQGVTIITNTEPMLPVVRTPVIEQDHRRGRLARSWGGVQRGLWETTAHALQEGHLAAHVPTDIKMW